MGWMPTLVVEFQEMLKDVSEKSLEAPAVLPGAHSQVRGWGQASGVQQGAP